MSSCISDLLSEKWRLVERDCLNSFGLLTIFSELLVTLASDWVKLLFAELSEFHSDFPVLVSREVVLGHNKIQISDNLWILQNVVLDFIDTDNSPLRMFPVSFFLSLWLLDFIRSNTFDTVQQLACWIKIPSAYIDTVKQLFFVNLRNIFATTFSQPYWYT